MTQKKRLNKHVVSFIVVLLVSILSNIPMKQVKAKDPNVYAPAGIEGNGTGGITIDIKKKPYTEARFEYNGNSYVPGGCTWFATARAYELTNKAYTVTRGCTWYKKYASQVGLKTGKEPRAQSFACYDNHISVVEKVDGNNLIISECSTLNRNYGCSHIVVKTRAKVESWSSGFGNFLGYVYFGSNLPTLDAPTIYTNTQLDGYGITINGKGTTYYSLDNSAFKLYSGPFSVTSTGNHTIAAYSTMSGYNQSNKTVKTIYISKAPQPVISKTESSNKVQVRLTCSNNNAKIYYSINGAGSYLYTAPIDFNKTTTISCYSKVAGMAVSDTISTTIKLDKPAIPTLKLKNTSNKIPVDDSAVLTWDSQAIATGYNVSVYEDGTLVKTDKVTGTSYSYKLTNAVQYEFKVSAYNIFGTSDESQAITVTGMPKVTVQFVDWDETPLTEVYTIKYGGSVAAPDAPSREGYTFQRWNGSYENVTKNTIITPVYKIKTFSVKFYDQDGKTLLSNKDVAWDTAATPPDVTDKIPTGYVFSGWCVDPKSECTDYKHVKGTMTLYATYAWENENLPVTIKDLTANCTANSIGQYYNISMKLYSSKSTDIRGRIIAELQTTNGTTKAVTTEDITLKAGAAGTEKSLTLNSYADGAYVYAYFVALDDKDNTAGCISKSAKAQVTREKFYGDWSDWSTTEPTDANALVEQKTQYRYNTKITATSTTSKTMSGYTYQNTTSTTGGWSSWGDTAISTVNTDALKREVETKQVVTGTNYTYAHYCTGNVSGAQYWTEATKTAGNSTFQAKCTYHNLGTFSSTNSNIKSGNGGYIYYPNGGTTKYRCSNTCYTWYRVATSNTYKTQYRYRDTTYVHNFYKVSDYTDWADTEPTGSYNDKQTRTVYRYKTVTDENLATETDSEKHYTLSGIVDDAAGDLTGKVATVMVYKKSNTDPTSSQLEFLDQITIGENNSYSVDVWPREELSEDTGDFVISLAVEGANRLVNVDVIEAPKSKYTVTFIADGKTVLEELVPANGTASLPNLNDIPEVDGMVFENWDGNISNVTKDVVIKAIYTQKDCEVTYIDALYDTVETVTQALGSPIAKDAPENPDGHTFKGWNAETVTGDMVVEAIYERNIYTVTFVNVDGETLFTDKVAYGESAMEPAITNLSAPAGATVTGWSKDSAWWEVTEDMIVYPIVTYDETVENPYSLTSNVINFIKDEDDPEPYYPAVFLETPTEDAQIYYTTDGSDPDPAKAIIPEESTGETEAADNASDEIVSASESEESIETTSSTYLYSDGITISEDMTVKAIAIKENMNSSDVVTYEFKINSDPSSADWLFSDYYYVIPEGLAFPAESGTMSVDDKLKLELTFMPEDTTVTDVTWESSEPSIVSVDEAGNITALKEGNSVITVTSVINDEVSAQYRITVKSKDDTNNEETPGEETPGEETPGNETPGNETPGNETPGEETPGNIENQKPDTQKPGTQNPDTQNPNTQNPGTQKPTGQTSSKIDISNAVVSGLKEIYYYDGYAISPSVQVSINGTTLQYSARGKDYKLEYINNKTIGTAKIKITGVGNYTGTIEKTFVIGIKKGARFYNINKITYDIVNPNTNGTGTVKVDSISSNAKTVVIPDVVSIGGVLFKVTEIPSYAMMNTKKITKLEIGDNVTKINANAFNGCKKLKKISIKSSKIKSIGKNAFKGIQSKATIEVPMKKYKAYKKKLSSKTGVKKSMKIKKKIFF